MFMFGKGMAFEQVADACADIGYAGIEVWGCDDVEFPKQCEYARAKGLRMTSFIGGGAPLNDPATRGQAVEELAKSVDIAAKFDVPGLICICGDRREGVSDEEALVDTAETLKAAAPHAEANCVTLNLELLNSKVDHIGYQCDCTEWAVGVVEKVNSPRVRVLYDIYHMAIMEGDLIRTIQNNIQWFGHFHTAGNPGRHEFDDSQELNYTGICSGIAATDYDGYVAHEFSPTGDPIDALKDAFRRCDVG
jgi:hydroxypyruvate isomerase